MNEWPWRGKLQLLWFNVRLSNVRPELAACYFRSYRLEPSLGSGVISHSLWDWLAKPTAQDDGRHGSFPPWKWCFFILFLFVFGSDTWKASQIRSRLECQHFRALSFNTWRRHNNCKKVCGGRFSFFRGIMVLVLALSIFYCHFSLLIAYFSTCWENNMKRMVREVKWEP